MITVRLDEKLEKQLDMEARNLGMTRSELVRRSIVTFLEKNRRANAWEAGKDLIGRYASGRTNLSADRKTLFRERLEEKRK